MNLLEIISQDPKYVQFLRQNTMYGLSGPYSPTRATTVFVSPKQISLDQDAWVSIEWSVCQIRHTIDKYFKEFKEDVFLKKGNYIVESDGFCRYQIKGVEDEK